MIVSSDSRYRDLDLWIPETFHTEFVRSDTLVKRGDDPYVAFSRQIDLWWYAVAIGIQKGKRTPLPDRKNLVRFNEAGVLESNPWRITHLELVALAELGGGVVTEPSRVILHAHEYAMTGFKILTQELRSVADLQLHLLTLLSSNNGS